ncbi:recombinase family protein [Tsuneonella sp. CC-YZS046]|uniref:recombinase family protein n=1 Tax=Tsuneonella sp. CC-YZS046 TaxID=3042152 RepID=UPI002D77EF13|nr:recombinase family protein [Tsuneonella sp. CC-YZS046]WRO66642.1 recombinase family protein [Tsuneonella sp. CC-YZS046]
MAAKIRCAIYTRKSTEEGLEQEFNSLDAQREACAAYILSQRHEGWVEVRQEYDDGGFSGGNMERPGLKRMLADIQGGRIDVIVVYKVDRLTRSLADFARIVDILDKRGASFVSVTQAFNTTTSMGRLTLNVLLSFAQFEREVTGERIRDKIAASKAKGMWMGGPVPLGYVVKERKLLIDEAEAKVVRHIFTRYLALGSGQKLVEELWAEGYRTKLRHPRNGVRGGVPFQRGPLFTLLSNPIYIGEISHKGTRYPGEHPAIIDRALWDQVQDLIERNRSGLQSGARAEKVSLLAGIIRDGHDRRITPSHTARHGRRYRYYITHASEVREGDPPAWRMPAMDVEKAVIRQLEDWLNDRQAIRSILPGDISADTLRSALAAAERAAKRLGDQTYRRTIVTSLIARVRIESDAIAIELSPVGLAQMLGLSSEPDIEPVTLHAPAAKVRRGNTTRLVLGYDANIESASNGKLRTLLREAQAARGVLLSNPSRTINQIATERKLCRHRFAKLVRLSWLAPDIITAIIKGSHPPSLTPRQLLDANLPINWSDQKALLGFD